MEWQAIERIQPFDNERIEWQLAQMSSQFYNAWKGTDSPALPINDFIVFDGEQPEEPVKQTAEDHMAVGEVMVASGFVKKG